MWYPWSSRPNVIRNKCVDVSPKTFVYYYHINHQSSPLPTVYCVCIRKTIGGVGFAGYINVLVVLEDKGARFLEVNAPISVFCYTHKNSSLSLSQYTWGWCVCVRVSGYTEILLSSSQLTLRLYYYKIYNNIRWILVYQSSITRIFRVTVFVTDYAQN